MRPGLAERRPRARRPSGPDLGREGKPLSRAAPPSEAPRPPGSRGWRDSRPSAAPAGPSSWCPGAGRQVSASQVSCRKWRPARARAREQEAGGEEECPSPREAPPSRPLRPRRRCALQIRLRGQRRRAARIRPRARPLPGPRPALLLKGAQPSRRPATRGSSDRPRASSRPLERRRAKSGERAGAGGSRRRAEESGGACVASGPPSALDRRALPVRALC
ncbi:translation initiation factor IF-2 [Desmodus rotundus]|uniref:translation initiation factor IF-2 n=1 Tax=Desmodus rotundus TaxID=9430 RepID=UPI002380CFF7|nr:translation initiation factor IF-2-like [Desmodus rotundus]XP_053779884.1 translation initiation factor IF-2-like [Desmodus rotundus]